MVTESVALDNLHGFQLFQPCFLADLVLTFIGIMFEMAYVSNIADITNLVTEMSQELEQYIVSYSRPGVAQMGITVHCRAANIHAHMPFVNRFLS